MLVRLTAMAATAALLAAAPCRAEAQQTGIRYQFSTDNDKGKNTDAVVYVLGDRSRIEPGSDEGNAGDDDDDYLILRESDLIAVDPAERSYSISDRQHFERIVGTAMRAVSSLVQMKVDDVEISTLDLGDSDTLLGYRTRHYRMTQRFTVHVRALGIQSDEEPEVHEIVSDFWVAPQLKLPRNPLVEVIMSAPSAMAQQSQAFAKRSSASRDALFEGMPLRVVVRTREGAGKLEQAARVDVTKIERVKIAPEMFEIPSGFRRTDKIKLNSM